MLDASQQRAKAALARTPQSSDDLENLADEPPVVARLMIEIRSDGSQTVARGALKDEVTGEQVSLVARGRTPLELAGQLTKALMTLPLTASQLARARVSGKAPPNAVVSDDSSDDLSSIESPAVRLDGSRDGEEHDD